MFPKIVSGTSTEDKTMAYTYIKITFSDHAPILSYHCWT